MSKRDDRESKMFIPVRGYRAVPKHFFEEPVESAKTSNEIYWSHRDPATQIEKHLLNIFTALNDLEIHVEVGKHDPSRLDKAMRKIKEIRQGSLHELEGSINDYIKQNESYTPTEVQKQFKLSPRPRNRYFMKQPDTK